MKKLLLLVVALIGLAVLIAVVSVNLRGGRSTPLADDTVLRLRLDQPLVDYLPTPEVPFLRRIAAPSLVDIYLALRRARQDGRVEGLVVEIHHAAFSLAQAEELRRQIQAVAAAGKTVECYLETAGEGTNGTLAYFVATACPRITLSTPGELNIIGLYADSLFFRGTLDKLKIEPEFEHAGAYKSASETYTQRQHSSSSREALSSLLDDLYEQIVTAIAEARGLETSRVRQLIDGAPYVASEALDLGLIDALAYPDEFDDGVTDTLGSRDSWLDLHAYGSQTLALRGQKIAVAFAQGTIVRGAGGVDAWSREMFVGSSDFGAVLRRLGDDDSIAAVILRVDSPGGSALASDLLLREVERLAEIKPVVVSMSGVAASGGYYISTKAEHIVAESMTITGSIGVVAGRLLTRRFQEELLGISHDVLRRGANADFYSSLDRWRPAQRQRFVEIMNGVYETFVGHVAEGREMDVATVEEVAQGRVWSGLSAAERGLVDELGGFDAALLAAASAADLDPDEVRLALYPAPPSLFEFLTGQRDPGLFSHWLFRRLLDSENPLFNLRLPPDLASLNQLS